jgi:hypothetical protein
MDKGDSFTDDYWFLHMGDCNLFGNVTQHFPDTGAFDLAWNFTEPMNGYQNTLYTSDTSGRSFTTNYR